MIITTKRGNGKKVNINFGTDIGFSPSFAHKNFETVSATMNRQLLYERYYNYRINSGAQKENAEAYAQWRTDEYITSSTELSDWGDALYRSGTYQNYRLSISGNINGNTGYYVSGVYTKDAGRVSANDADRFSGRINVSQRFMKIFEWNSNIFYSKAEKAGVSDYKNEDNLFYMERAQLLEQWPAYEPDGSLYMGMYPSGQYNPLYTGSLTSRKSEMNRIFVNESLKARLAECLEFETKFGYDGITAGEDIGYSTGHPSDDLAGWKYTTDTEWTRISSYNHITYNRNILEKHRIYAKGGFEFEKVSFKQDMFDEQCDIYNEQLSYLISGTDYSTYKRSWLLYAGYEFDSRFTVSASFRHENASSRNAPLKHNIFGISGTWHLANEEFLSRASWISSLNLYMAYNKNNSKFSIDMEGIQYPDNGKGYFNYSKTDIGINGSLLGNRLHFDINRFSIRSKNPPYLSSTVEQSTGHVKSEFVPYGDIKNSGIEITLHGDIIATKEWQWSIGLNLASISSEFSDNSGYPKRLYKGNMMQFVPTDGKSPNCFYGYRYAGVNSNNGYAMWYTEDGSVTENISDAYKCHIGCTDPKAYGGINTSLSWKRFALDMNFTYSFGGDVYDSRRHDISGYPKYSKDFLNRWQQPEDITDIPVLMYGAEQLYESFNDMYICENNYVRLKQLAITYSFPSNITDKLKMSGLKLTLSATNLLTFSNNSDFDPEAASIYGCINWAMPMSRTYMFGISIGF